MASGLVNGVATMLLALFVDPKVSVLADDVAKGKRSYTYLKWASITMAASRVAGTIFAQVLFIPASAFSKNSFKHAKHYAKRPSLEYVKDFRFRYIPKRLFVLNMVITAIYTIGVLAALYAGVLVPERHTTAVTGKLVDVAGADALSLVGSQFRFLIFGSTVGTIFGMLLLPTFVAVFSRAIVHLAGENGSVLQVFRKTGGR
ncbi:DUF2837 family protein [Bacillus licheniformis]|nr:DUF2837 family protein [Bacillus licheniformis]